MSEPDTKEREAEQDERDELESPERGAVSVTEAIVPVAGMAFSIYYMSTIWNLPYEARMSGTLLSAAIFGFTGMLFVRWFKQAREHGVEAGFWSLVGTGAAGIQRLGVLALAIAYVFLLPHLGFFICTLVFLIASMALLGIRKPAQLALVPLIMTSVGYGLFVLALGISLPTGIVDSVLRSIFQAVGF